MSTLAPLSVVALGAMLIGIRLGIAIDQRLDTRDRKLVTAVATAARR
jgi:hypothetical protein